MLNGTDPFDFGQDTFDSREVIDRIAYLEDSDMDEEEQQEFDDLRAFEEEASGYVADWNFGEGFISDDYFEEYAKELADDIGAVKDDTGWPGRHIDWEAAADELKQDYISFELRGTTYWAL